MSQVTVSVSVETLAKLDKAAEAAGVTRDRAASEALAAGAEAAKPAKAKAKGDKG